MRFPIILISLLWFGAFTGHTAEHYVVPANGNAADPYTNWATAGTNIIEVVNAAMTNTAPRTVWVTNGTYTLTNQILITNDLTLQSIAGHGPDDTIINGNFTPGSPQTNRCLLMSNAAAFVSGLTFSNGACLAETNNGGGGVRIYSGILSNCTVLNNTVFTPGDQNAMGGGGGIYIRSGGTVTACRVAGNLVTNTTTSTFGYGGGIYSAGSCYIYNCLISNNVMYGGVSGGYRARAAGVFLSGGIIRSSMICNNYFGGANGCEAGGIEMDGIMESCTSTFNRGSSGGGCVLTRGTITNCLISYNSASTADWAGGIHVNLISGTYDFYIYNTTITGNTNYGVIMGASTTGKGQMINCIIENNTMRGVQMNANNHVLSNCMVRGNQNGGVRGLGIIRNCLITGNTTNGGLWIPSSCQTALVSCCTIAGNVRTNSGAGIRIEATSANILSISSCIIYSNGVSGIDDVFDAASPANINALQYSCIGTNPGFTGAGIISNANPRFVDFAGGNYHLDANSPCINRGSNEPAWMTNSVDLDGGPRIRYGTVDMGTYERLNSGSIFGFH